jgi:hypothetical protein
MYSWWCLGRLQQHGRQQHSGMLRLLRCALLLGALKN